MIRKSAWLFPPSRVRSTYPKCHDQEMLAQDNTGTRTLKWVSDHALNGTVRSNGFGCLVILRFARRRYADAAPS